MTFKWMNQICNERRPSSACRWTGYFSQICSFHPTDLACWLGSGQVVSLRSASFTLQVWLDSGQVVSLRSASFTPQVWLDWPGCFSQICSFHPTGLTCWLDSGQVVSLRSAAFTPQVWLAGLALARWFLWDQLSPHRSGLTLARLFLSDLQLSSHRSGLLAWVWPGCYSPPLK